MNSTSYLTDLYQLITGSFSWDELRLLCFHMGITHEDILGQSKSVWLHEFLGYVNRRGRIVELRQNLEKERPMFDWPPVPDHLKTPGVVQRIKPPVPGHVQDFCDHYLESTIGFGGRDKELKQLNDWLTKPDENRLLLIAPAGRGKSALLTHWSKQLADTENWVVLFVPISLRFETHSQDRVYSYLAEQLAYLHGDSVAGEPAQQWPLLIHEYMREPLPNGRKLLLILDGLDEAGWKIGPSLIPVKLPATTCVVVAARQRTDHKPNFKYWRRRLAWEKLPVKQMTLETLSEAGVRQVLSKTRFTPDELGEEEKLVAILHKVSEGDPLLLELYIQSLLAGEIEPSELRNRQPGYEIYFEAWWAEQEKLWGESQSRKGPLVQSLLDLLSSAKGPIKIADIQELLLKKSDVHSSKILEIISSTLNRFVVNDGLERGFVFSHPKLASYFWERLTPPEKKQLQQEYRNWGNRTLKELREDERDPYEVSEYLMLHYGRHLEDANAKIEDSLELVTWEWMQVWHKKTGKYSDFLQDVDRVWARLRDINKKSFAQQGDVPYIGQEVLCALCHASVNSLANNLPDDLLVLLLQFNLWTDEQVIAFIKQRQSLEEQYKGLAAVLPYLKEQTRLNVLDEILSTPLDTILDAAETSFGPSWWEKVLVAIAPFNPSKVLTASELLNTRKNSVIKAVAPYIPDEALAATDNLSYKYLPGVLVEVIKSEKASQSLRRQVLQMTLEHFAFEYNERSKVDILVELAPHLPTETLAAARNLTKDIHRMRVLAAAYPPLKEMADERANEALKEIMHLANQLSGPLLKDRDWENMLLIIEAMFTIAPVRPAEECKTILRDVLGWVQSSGYYYHFVTLGEILEVTAAYLLSETLEIVKNIEDDDRRFNVLKAISGHIPDDLRAELFSQELILVRKIEGAFSESRKSRRLIELSQFLPDAVLATMDIILDKKERAKVYTAVAPYLPDKTKELLEKATAMYQNIHEPEKIGEHDWVHWSYIHMYPVGFMPEKILADVLEIGNNSEKFKKLGIIAQYASKETIPDGFYEVIWEHMQRFLREIKSAEELPEYIPKQRPPLQDRLIREMINVYNRLDEREALNFIVKSKHLTEFWREALLKEIVSQDSQQVLTIAQQETDESVKATILKQLSPYHPQQVLALATGFQDEWQKARVLISLAEQNPQEVFAQTKALQDEGDRTGVLIALAPYLPKEVFKHAKGMAYDGHRAKILIAIAASLPENGADKLCDEILRVGQELPDHHNEKWDLLAALTPHIPQQVMDVLETADRHRDKAKVYTALAPDFPEWVLDKFEEITLEQNQMMVLEEVAKKLPDAAIATARKIEDSEVLAKTIAAALPALPPEHRLSLIQEAFELAVGINDRERSLLFVELNNRLVECLMSKSWDEPHEFSWLYDFWDRALPVFSQQNRSQLLMDIGRLMPFILFLGGETAVLDTLQAVQTASEWWP